MKVRFAERLPIRSSSSGESTRYVKGDRIRLSELGLSRHPHYAEREGTVVGWCVNPSGIRILWDGTGSPIAMYRDYLRPV